MDEISNPIVLTFGKADLEVDSKRGGNFVPEVLADRLAHHTLEQPVAKRPDAEGNPLALLAG